MNIDDIMNADYPLPDPNWDYAQIYSECQSALIKLQKTINFMSEQENATLQTDAQIKQYLDQIGQQLNSVRRMIDS